MLVLCHAANSTNIALYCSEFLSVVDFLLVASDSFTESSLFFSRLVFHKSSDSSFRFSLINVASINRACQMIANDLAVWLHRASALARTKSSVSERFMAAYCTTPLRAQRNCLLCTSTLFLSHTHTHSHTQTVSRMRIRVHHDGLAILHIMAERRVDRTNVADENDDDDGLRYYLYL